MLDYGGEAMRARFAGLLPMLLAGALIMTAFSTEEAVAAGDESVLRIERIRIRARDRQGELFEEQADGMLAVCLQHEIDHLDGKLFVDYLSPLKQRMVRRKLEKQRRQQKADEPARTIF